MFVALLKVPKALEQVLPPSTGAISQVLLLDDVEHRQRRGLSINLVRGGTGGQASCIRMAPPLTVSEDEIDLAATIIDDALRTVVNRTSAAAATS